MSDCLSADNSLKVEIPCGDILRSSENWDGDTIRATNQLQEISFELYLAACIRRKVSKEELNFDRQRCSGSVNGSWLGCLWPTIVGSVPFNVIPSLIDKQPQVYVPLCV